MRSDCKEQGWGLKAIDPEGLGPAETYSHVIVTTGTRLVFIAGQVAEDATGQLVGPGDFATQASQVFTNLGIALKAAGVRPNDVAKISIYVVDLTADHLPLIERARAALFDEHKPTDVLLGIDTLAHPGCLIEVEAIAVTGTTEP